MKHYLLIPFLFLAAFSSGLPCFGQDTPSHQEQPVNESSPEETLEDSSRDEGRSPDRSPFADQRLPSRLDDPYSDPLVDPVATEPDDFQSKFMNMMLLLGLLIGFMILASWMLKRMTRSRVTQLNQASVIKVLETRFLSPRSTLYLLEIQGQNLLIAESPTGVTHLASFEAIQEPESEPENSGESQSNSRSLPPYFSGPSKPAS